MASSKNRLARGQAWALSAFALLASLVCFPSLVSAAQAPAGSYFQCQIDPMAESNFSLALFRIWLPPVEKGPIKGVLAVLPGSDAHGTPLADDPKWQEIAAKWNYGLLAVTFTTKSGAEPYYRAERGSGAAFVAALDELAALSARPELSSAPVAILGHSQGGQFAFHFTCWRPHRTIAFATIKGGFHDARPDAAARDVPGLILAGAKDAEFRRKNLRDLFDANPWPASRWAYVEEPGAGHELGHCLDLIVPFFHTIVTSQIQPYVGRIDDFHVEPANPSLAGLSVWLPSPDVASLWVKLMTNWSSPGANGTKIRGN